MKFKEGDLVEVIWRSELYRGAVTRVVEATNEIEVKLAKKPLIDYLFKQSQVSKVDLVKVPKFVADWISEHKAFERDLLSTLDIENPAMPKSVFRWLCDNAENQELFARAWLDGYEVEQEPLYYVRFFDGKVGFLQVYLNGVRLVGWRNKSEEYKVKFTESEIKDINENYWAFRVPVSELEGE
ncbi:TPA: DUF1642 domain-containing protein [Listeria monocytogenes]|nr:DUF1642 domain-containing protein [Listeria monocytogenes]